MSLTDAKIRKLKRSAKPFKISDSHGLYLLVNPGGSRLWYLKFRLHGKSTFIEQIKLRHAVRKDIAGHEKPGCPATCFTESLLIKGLKMRISRLTASSF